MGHAHAQHVERCRSRCPERQTLVVLSVREPYSYWISLYAYAVKGVATSVHPPEDALASLDAFLDWVGDGHQGITQTARVRRACGEPCVYDALLRTESLRADWAELLAGLRVPAIALPHTNENAGASHSHASPDRGSTEHLSHSAQVAALTREQRERIAVLDQWIFTTFGYERV
jgi:hypothetical protein